MVDLGTPTRASTSMWFRLILIHKNNFIRRNSPPNLKNALVGNVEVLGSWEVMYCYLQRTTCDQFFCIKLKSITVSFKSITLAFFPNLVFLPSFIARVLHCKGSFFRWVVSNQILGPPWAPPLQPPCFFTWRDMIRWHPVWPRFVVKEVV